MPKEVLIVTRNINGSAISSTVVKTLSKRRAKKIIEATEEANESTEDFYIEAFPLWLDKRSED